MTQPPTLIKDGAFIDGAFVTDGEHGRFEVTNPATGEVIGTLPRLGASEAGRAIDAAEADRTFTGKSPDGRQADAGWVEGSVGRAVVCGPAGAVPDQN